MGRETGSPPAPSALATLHVATDTRTVSVFPLHAHDYFEMELVLAGEGTQTVNGAPMSLARGSLYLLSPGDFHEITASRGLVLDNIVFDGTVLPPERVREIFGALPFCRTAEETTLTRLHDTVRLLGRERDVTRCRLLTEYLLRLSADRPGCDTETVSPVMRAAMYVQSHFRENPGLSEAAGVACLSPAYFGSCFHREMGCRYNDYLTDCKLSCARMLLAGGMTVTEACFDAGFGSLSGFRYACKRRTGHPPEYFRPEKE